MTPRPGLALALLLSCLLAPGAFSDETESVRETKVKEILASLKGATPAAIWNGSDELIAMGAPVKRILQDSLKEASVEGKLCLLRALLELESTTLATEELMKLAREESLPVPQRVLALELVGISEERDAEEGLGELILSLNPDIRIAAARALWRLGSAARGQMAKDVLREMLKSSDAGLRASGALALAEIGDGETPGVQETLRELAREPSLRGQLAAALLAKLSLQNTLLRLEAKGESGSAAAAARGLWTPLDEIRLRLRELYDHKEGIEDDALRAAAAHGLMTLPNDPHSAFMDPEENADWNAELDPTYGGIGALIDTNAPDFRISRPFFGGPAWKADIRTGDRIVAVNGKPTEGREQTEVVKEVKGPPGTTVILTIFREGWTETRDIPVIRAKITLPTVFSRVLPGKIGYIEISNFGYETGEQFRTQLAGLEAQGIVGLVIDLRWNPGGALTAVKECLSPFLRANELICTIRGRSVPPEKHFATAPDRERPYPISVLINGRSASGAELMSGVLQHYSRSSGQAQAKSPYLDAIVLGEPSFGKGTVQYTMNLDSWPGEKFTDQPRKNGTWDPGERYTDANGNGEWDPGEPLEDTARMNRRWDDAEKFEDRNGNGVWDPGEAYSDSNGDGAYNPAEPFDDTNRNGRYDWGAALRMTVARYYLPSGRNFTRERLFKEGKYVYEGGVMPDLEVPPPPMKASHLAEFQEIQQDRVLADYVRSRWAQHAGTFRRLAYEDARDPSAYPDLDALQAQVAKCLTRQEFRRAVRIEVRRQVMNESGTEIRGDLSDDNVLRRGVMEIFRRLKVDPASIPEYQALAQRENEE